MSGRSYTDGASSGQQYSSSSRYRNNNEDHRAGFGSSTPMNPYMNDNNNNHPQNIMHDRRVIRGSTCSLRRSIENRLNNMDSQQSKRSTLKRNTLKRRNKNMNNSNNNNNNKSKTPRPISGRIHAEIQTDAYLEEIFVSKNEKDFGTQTDPFLDRPSTPLFVPKSSGKSIATQIEDGDLFDFDSEVEPLLEVLIGRTMQESLMEVLEEEELKSYKKYKQQFKQKRDIQLAECQRLEQEEQRKFKEKQNRIEQAKIFEKKEKLLKERIAAQKIATEFLENIENAVFTELNERGHFYNPIIKEIEDIFVPNLLVNVEEQIKNENISNQLIDDIIHCFVDNLLNESVQIIHQRDEQKKQMKIEKIFKKKLNEKFVEKRREFTKSIKSQKKDYDFKEQIISFLDLQITPPPKEKKIDEDKNDDDEKEEEEEPEEPEIPKEIQQNIEYIDNLMEQFENDEEPLWKQIKSMLDKIDGETQQKIERIDQYLQSFAVKLSKKNLLETFEIYKEDEENLKKAISDCLGVDSFDEESHNKYLDALKGDEQKDQMQTINEFVNDKENAIQFIDQFIKQKKDERIAAEEAKKAQEAAENEQEETEQDEENE